MTSSMLSLPLKGSKSSLSTDSLASHSSSPSSTDPGKTNRPQSKSFLRKPISVHGSSPSSIEIMEVKTVDGGLLSEGEDITSIQPEGSEEKVHNIFEGAVDTLVMHGVIKEGWIWRKNFFGQWKRLYAITRAPTPYKSASLLLYKDFSTIDLMQCISIDTPTRISPRGPSTPDRRWEVRLQIHLPPSTHLRTITLAVDTFDECIGWTALLGDMIGRVSIAKMRIQMEKIEELGRLRGENKRLKEVVTRLKVEKLKLESMYNKRGREIENELQRFYEENSVDLKKKDIITESETTSLREDERISKEFLVDTQVLLGRIREKKKTRKDCCMEEEGQQVKELLKGMEGLKDELIGETDYEKKSGRKTLRQKIDDIYDRSQHIQKPYPTNLEQNSMILAIEELVSTISQSRAEQVSRMNQRQFYESFEKHSQLFESHMKVMKDQHRKIEAKLEKVLTLGQQLEEIEKILKHVVTKISEGKESGGVKDNIFGMVADTRELITRTLRLFDKGELEKNLRGVMAEVAVAGLANNFSTNVRVF